MNKELENKLMPQCKALGRIFRIVSDATRPHGATMADISNAQRRPLFGLGLIMPLCFRLHKCDLELDRMVTELLDIVNIDDWKELNGAVSLELQGAWIVGYTLGYGNREETKEKF